MKQEYGIDMEKDQYSKLIQNIPEADLYVSMDVMWHAQYSRKADRQLGIDDPTGRMIRFSWMSSER